MLDVKRIEDTEVLTINRPQAGNSINSDLTSALIENLERSTSSIYNLLAFHKVDQYTTS